MRERRRRRINKYHVGRVRIAAAKLLNKYFPDWDVRPEHIIPASGRYRTDHRLDTFRWELFTYTKSGMPVVLGSWDKLTEFVRFGKIYGVELNDDRELYANRRAK